MSRSERRQQFKKMTTKVGTSRALEKRVENLEEAFDHNTTLFSEALANLEMRISLVGKALDDIVSGKPRVKGIGDDATVDWSSYYEDYLAEQAALKEKEAEQAVQEEAPPSEYPENAVIFGGDS